MSIPSRIRLFFAKRRRARRRATTRAAAWLATRATRREFER